jgi:DNA-binding IclR family transcriptional regulator
MSSHAPTVPRWSRSSVLNRQLRILDEVIASDELLKLSQIAERAGLPASTAHRLVGELCDAGLLRRSPWRTYTVGPTLRELANHVRHSAE